MTTTGSYTTDRSELALVANRRMSQAHLDLTSATTDAAARAAEAAYRDAANIYRNLDAAADLTNDQLAVLLSVLDPSMHARLVAHPTTDRWGVTHYANRDPSRYPYADATVRALQAAVYLDQTYGSGPQGQHLWPTVRAVDYWHALMVARGWER